MKITKAVLESLFAQSPTMQKLFIVNDPAIRQHDLAADAGAFVESLRFVESVRSTPIPEEVARAQLAERKAQRRRERKEDKELDERLAFLGVRDASPTPTRIHRRAR